jgi:hypothetical protein
MQPRSPWRIFVAHPSSAVLMAAAVLLSTACQEQPPTEPEFGRVNARYQLTVKGDPASAGGVVTSDRGGISCTVASSGGATSGKCSQTYKSGAIVTLHMTPVAGAAVPSTAPTACPFNNESQHTACEVVLDQSKTVAFRFEVQTNTVTLSVGSGSSGSGRITSNVAGIDCTITNGVAAVSGCASSYPLNASVTLTATASTGNYLKAWAGGGCETTGSGVGLSTGACTVSMTQARSLLVSFDRPANAAVSGQWGSPIPWPALAIHANLLPDGRVMTWGRSDRLPVIWNPVSGAFKNVDLPADLFCSGHALMPDGRLLVSGGHSGVDNQGLLSTQIFDYRTDTWVTPAPRLMQNGRWYPSVLALPSGEMLTVSGGDTAKALNQIPEVWTNNAWRPLSNALANIAYYPMMFSAPDGRVFVAGPDQVTGFLTTSGLGSRTSGPASLYGYRDYGSAVMYEPGKIIMMGGGGPTATAETIDLNTGGGWQSVPRMKVARRQLSATLLADGTVLVTGGTNASGFNTKPTNDSVLAAERWVPGGGWTYLARQSHYRLYHSNALLLPDGRVLSVGSGQPAASGLSDDFTAEIYSPPYLFDVSGGDAVRPTLSTVASASYNQTFAATTSNTADIAKITLIRLSTVTHSTNMNQRLVNLLFTITDATTLTVTAPASAFVAPPGYYMLFLVNRAGTPSVAKIVQITN